LFNIDFYSNKSKKN